MSLLRELPRTRDDVPEARTRFESYRGDFATLRPELVVDRPPGTPTVDYDILIEDPNGGTAAITWRGDHGAPWPLEHADHWAANYVLTVAIGADKRTVTNQHALATLHFAAHHRPDLMRELVDGALLALEIERDRPLITPDEIQQAADEMRRALGLHTAKATRRWMEQMQITPKRFRGLATGELMVAKVKERIVASEVERYFIEHRPDFDKVRYSRATTPDPEAGRELASSARADDGLIAAASARLVSIASSTQSVLFVGVADAAACELPVPIRLAAPGDVIGPFVENGAMVVAQVLARTPAVLDSPTRILVRERVLREWLDRRAAQATIRWHWM